jgi:glycosyltransferase involved in cell wall biosynthesis
MRLRAAFRHYRPDVVQGWMYHGNLAASFGRRVAGCTAPLVWSVHNTLEGLSIEFRWYTRLAMRLGAKLSGTTAAIVYVATASALEHEQLGFSRDRRVVIPNGIDCDLFHPDSTARPRLRADLGLAPGVPLVGLFARWAPMKDHASLLAAARRLRDEGTGFHLVLAGTGINASNRALVDGIDAAGLREHISLLGERDDVPTLMPALDVFVLSSAWGEAFPLVLGEAMAAGVPCIATDVGDCSHIIGDPGRVVPARNSSALADALRQLLRLDTRERERLGRVARQRVLSSFTLPAMARRYEELYASLHHGEVYGDSPP